MYEVGFDSTFVTPSSIELLALVFTIYLFEDSLETYVSIKVLSAIRSP